jgi:hypothetical protein
MASENTAQHGRQPRRITSENTTAALQAYHKALATAPLSSETRRTYVTCHGDGTTGLPQGRDHLAVTGRVLIVV